MKTETSKKIVPKLRFPEFKEAGEWRFVALHKCCDQIRDKMGKKKITPVSITAGVGFVSQIEKFGRDISGAQYPNYIHIKKGDFAYNRGNSKLFPQGCIYRLKNFENAAASTAFYCFRLRNDYEYAFFEGLFASNHHGKQLLKYITSTARSDGLLNISADSFFKIGIPLPPKVSEQQKIADCLSSLDELIAVQTEKLELLKEYKKGLMQQLFPRPCQVLV